MLPGQLAFRLDAADGVPPSANQRFDFAPIGQVETTPQGFLRIPAVLGRVGVLRYAQPNGTVRREFRPPEEVFHADSMRTLSGAVVTDLHPPRDKAWITPDNVKEYAVGFAGEQVKQDGARLLSGVVTVFDKETIRKINAGERREISPGYVCLNLDETPGRWNGKEYGPHVQDGEPYDVIQRDIVYNSVGIGPRGWGRQGADVALRLDAADTTGAILKMDASQLGEFLRSHMELKGLTVLGLAKTTGIIAPEPSTDDPRFKDPLLHSGSICSRTWILENILDGWTDQPSKAQLTALAAALDVEIDTLIRLLPAELQTFDAAITDTEEPDDMTIELIKMNLDGLEIEVPKASAQVIERFKADQASKLKVATDEATKLKTDGSALQGRLDGLTEENGKLKTSLAEAPAKARAAAIERLGLESKVHAVLGNGADGKPMTLDGKTDRELQIMVIGKLSPKVTLDGKDDAYVGGRFDAALEGFRPADASTRAKSGLFGKGGPVTEVRQDAGDEPDPDKARAAMVESGASAWQPKSEQN